MRRMTMPLLNIVMLVTFVRYIQLQESNNGDNRCLTLDRHGNCSCCKSGFRGQTCNDSCEHCLSRIGMEQSCTYYCKTGYYGDTCEERCPKTCAPGINDPYLCKEKYGLPVCVRCFPGSYGKQCEQTCHANCLDGTCYQTHGKCLSCSSDKFYGDHCRLPCNQGCISGTCNRTGRCTHGCKFGFYGERCEYKCGSNCKQGKCTSHEYHEYNCTEGCHGGFWGTSCLEKCPNHCTECEHQNGRCTLCVEAYVQKPKTRECVKEGKPAVTDVSNLIIIGIVVIVVIILSGIIIMIIWKRRRHRHRGSVGGYAEECGLLTCSCDNIRQPEHIPLIHPSNYQGGGEGVRNADLVDLQIQDIQNTFIKTSIYDLVEEKLKTKGHVTISGASGEGKTSMALMLGNEYRKRGYQLVFVTNPTEFNTEIVKGRKTLCIFDDIFGTERLAGTSKLKEVLLFVELYLKQAKQMADAMKDIESANRKETDELNFMVVFTSKTYNLKSGISKLPECKYFINSSVVDMTDAGYSLSDIKKIFLKHKQMHNINENMPVEQIFNLKMLSFGFPLLCMMYFKLLYSKSIDVLSFFSEPITFLESEMKSIIKSKNEKSAALILMMLCEDGLNVSHLNNESGDTVFEKMVKKVQNLIKSLNRSDLANAARSFQGTFFTKGDIMYFSHPAITSACAFVIFETYPTFLLQNGSIKFLYERIHPVISNATMIDRKKNTMMISEKHSYIIAERLAEEIKKGEYCMTISHPILRNNVVVNKLFIKLHSPSVYFHERENHRCFLHWAVRAKSLYLIQQILKIETNFSPEEIQQACEACVTCGNTLILNLLFEKLASQITETVVINVSLAVVYTGNSEMFECILLKGKNLDLSSSLTPHGHNMLHAACIGGSKTIVERVSQWIDIDSQDQHGQTAIMLAVISGMEEVVTFLNKNGANLELKDKKGDTVFHLACQVGKKSIVEYLLPSCDINSRGHNGWTPVMISADSGKKEVFDLLVTKGADLTLTDKYSGTVLYRACWGGNAYIVEQLLQSTDINIQASNGWTPIMIPAYCGFKKIFDLLVAKEADLTLIDNYGSNLLHHACWGGNTSIVEHLLPLFDINSRGKNGLTPVMNAAYSGKKEVFDLLMTKGADLTLIDNYESNVLHHACWGGNISIVQRLLPSFDINSRGQDGHTPVMNAADSGKKETFEMLVTKGADLKLTNTYGNTVLHLASLGGNRSIVEHLLPKSDINSRGGNKRTPVMVAAYSGKKEIVDLLVTKEADLTLTDKYGGTVLHSACWGGHTSIVELLLPLFDINSPANNGWTPVMISAYSGFKELLDLLVSKGADLELIDNYRSNVLHHACWGGNTSIVEHLLPLFDINSRGENDRTSVMTAAYRGHKEVFDLLVTNGADLTLTDHCGNNVLHLACLGGNVAIVKFSTPMFNINKRGHTGHTPLMMAVCSGHMEVFDFLLCQHADLTLTNDGGDSLLHLACGDGNLDMVKHILTHFDINLRNTQGLTPAMIAAVNGRTEVFRYLIKNRADLNLVDNVGDDILTLAKRGGSREILQELSPAD